MPHNARAGILALRNADDIYTKWMQKMISLYLSMRKSLSIYICISCFLFLTKILEFKKENITELAMEAEMSEPGSCQTLVTADYKNFTRHFNILTF